MARTVEVCELVVLGRIETVNTAKKEEDRTRYVRLQGAGGQVSITVPEDVPVGNSQLRPGAEVVVYCDARPGRDGSYYLRAWKVGPGPGQVVEANGA